MDTAMFTRILTESERTKLLIYVERDEVPETLRLVMSRIKKFTPQIEQDLKLMQKARRKYDKRK
jgi:hypothetical protein